MMCANTDACAPSVIFTNDGRPAEFFSSWIFIWRALRLRIDGTRAAQAGACLGGLNQRLRLGRGFETGVVQFFLELSAGADFRL